MAKAKKAQKTTPEAKVKKTETASPKARTEAMEGEEEMTADAEAVTVINEVYFVNGSDANVTLKTTVGDPGQTAKTSATLTDAAGNHRPLFTEHDGALPKTVLGRNKELDGFVLTITCLVSATADDSTHCEEIILLQGGVDDKKYKLFETLEKKGDSTLPPFSAVFTFLKI